MKIKYFDLLLRFLASTAMIFYLPGLLWSLGTSTFFIISIGLIGLAAYVVWPRRISRQITSLRFIGLCMIALASAIPLEHLDWLSGSRGANPVILFGGAIFALLILACFYFSTRNTRKTK
jgi:hypothetical protein